tara:strand:+ start:839 stop:2281 length:1443 start_codon:yes stop_codon:yes gene_type:complete
MKEKYFYYEQDEFFDELLTSKGNPRNPAKKVVSLINSLGTEEIEQRQKAAELTIKDMGISFTVYSDGENIDRSWPYDIIPRIISSKEWDPVAEGLKQRSRALNKFINDVYNEQKVFKDNIAPYSLIKNSKNYKPQCKGITPKHEVWAHICGSDLVRDQNGKFYVLEDNLRVPSGVSYMLENRHVTKRVLPELFLKNNILPIDDYPLRLYETLKSISPRRIKKPIICVLTPGIFNSAYFEHSYLAQSMGAELVEGPDLFTSNNIVYMHTVDGPVRVDVVYRRIDDDYLDPDAFREDSCVGVKGIFKAWKKGNVGIANAPGSGVADDKAVYSYVPKFIEYYLNEKPLIDNVPTYLCVNKEDMDYVIENIASLVVKPANESGGYGILIGPQSSKKEQTEYIKKIKKNPREFIAQPTIKISTNPTRIKGSIQPRHVDLRPFILQGKESWVTNGGLTRVALKEKSLIVNSSQGGGSKDTWIIEAS